MSETTTATPGGAEVLPHPDVIRSSRRRSRAFGLNESATPDFSVVSTGQMTALLEQNRLLFAHALPVMETLYEQIINTHSMVLLTNSQGLILHALGDDDFLEKANRVALRPGVTWSEQSKGTNAIGTALAEGQPVLVHAAEHFLNVNHFLTCSCAPIIDPYGNVVGALDVTGDHNSYHKHTMALVRMSAQMIENHLFSSMFPEAVRIHFHSRPEFLGTLVEGIAAFSAAGRFLSANRSAQFQLGLSVKALQAHTFSSLFGMPMSALFDHYRASNPGHLSLCLHNGVSVRARAEFRAPATIFGPTQTASPIASEETPTVHASAPSALQRLRQGLSSLRYLNTGDPQIAAVINKVTKVQGRDIPILILGETGTGKEILAQAIHNDSSRRQGPFVAVNCASIPETLIESELFGYEEGAFTGARKKGGVGKILQANGGTLFLDEIGDMPLTLQARLLRVLQERTVTPLGSTKFIPVNLSVICATNRNLKEMIAAGTFREDLYYRLNGLVVKLPPLRERTDLETVIEKLLAAECECRKPLEVSAEVMRMFKQYHWPGNFRQLTNLLRTACVMAADDDMIDVLHMPDDFLDDLRDADAVSRTAPGNGGAAFAGSWSADDGLRAAGAPGAAGTRLEDVELSAIAAALRQHGGNVSAAARALNVSRNTIYRKMAAVEKSRSTDPA